MKIAFLILLCVIGFVLLPTFVSASSWVSHSLNSRSTGLDSTQLVVRNVTGTGTITADNFGVTILCDNGESFTNRFPMGVTLVNPSSRRVFFTIGIVDLNNVVLIPETPPTNFVIYQIQDLQKEADSVSVSRFFGAMQQPMYISLGHGGVSTEPILIGIISKPSIYGLSYDASYDLNGDGVINMCDISIAVNNLGKLTKTLP